MSKLEDYRLYGLTVNGRGSTSCPFLVVLLGNYAEVLRQKGRAEEAKELESRKIALENV